jgi:hypothetical protein
MIFVSSLRGCDGSAIVALQFLSKRHGSLSSLNQGARSQFSTCYTGTDGTGSAAIAFLCERRHRSAYQQGGEQMATATGTQSGLETRETTSLIGSDKVEGTAVYGADDRRIGKTERVMIDKISGKVAYAVLSFGGFLGIGEDYYPVPWSMLKYDTNLGGYRVNLTADKLKDAPKYTQSTGWNWSRENDQRVYDYYQARPYW